MCDCIQAIEKKVLDENNADSSWFENFGQQYSEVGYRPLRKDGKPSKVNRSTSVSWKFCPFCGEEIDRV